MVHNYCLTVSDQQHGMEVLSSLLIYAAELLKVGAAFWRRSTFNWTGNHGDWLVGGGRGGGGSGWQWCCICWVSSQRGSHLVTWEWCWRWWQRRLHQYTETCTCKSCTTTATQDYDYVYSHRPLWGVWPRSLGLGPSHCFYNSEKGQGQDQVTAATGACGTAYTEPEHRPGHCG